MKPQELDKARAAEAVRLARYEDPDRGFVAAEIAARLAREGWEPEDPLWIEAWKICDEYHGLLNAYQEARSKTDQSPKLAYAALRRGMELAQQNP